MEDAIIEALEFEATCPFCKEKIKTGATKCPHCQSKIRSEMNEIETDDIGGMFRWYFRLNLGLIFRFPLFLYQALWIVYYIVFCILFIIGTFSGGHPFWALILLELTGGFAWLVLWSSFLGFAGHPMAWTHRKFSFGTSILISTGILVGQILLDYLVRFIAGFTLSAFGTANTLWYPF